MARYYTPKLNYTASPSYRDQTVVEGPGSFMSGQRGAMDAYQLQLARMLGYVDVPGVNQVAPGVFINAPDPRVRQFASNSFLAGQLLGTAPATVTNPYVNQETGEAIEPTPAQQVALENSLAFANAPNNAPVLIGHSGISQQVGPSPQLRTPTYADQRRQAAANAVASKALQPFIQQQAQTAGHFVRQQISQNPAAWAEANPDAVNSFNNAILGPLLIDEQQAAFADAAAGVERDRHRKYLASRQAINNFASSGATQQQVDEANKTLAMRYPEFANAPAPKSRQQQLAEAQAAEELQFQQQLDSVAQQMGIPSVPVRRNEKGILEPAVDLSQMRLAQAQEQRNAVEAEKARLKVAQREFDAELSLLQESAGINIKNPHKVGDPPYIEFEKGRSRARVALGPQEKQLREKYFGGGQQQQPKPTPATVGQPGELPTYSGADAQSAISTGRLGPGDRFSAGNKVWEVGPDLVPFPVR